MELENTAALNCTHINWSSVKTGYSTESHTEFWYTKNQPVKEHKGFELAAYLRKYASSLF